MMENGMPHWIHSNFAQNAGAYAKAQKHWEKLWKKMVRATQSGHEWDYPWMKNSALDGNPIFSAVCPQLRRGIRIIQEERESTGPADLDWWIDHFGEEGSAKSIRELVISCCPSRENQNEIEALLQEWLETGDITIPPQTERAAI
jgi:hypothetical protein